MDSSALSGSFLAKDEMVAGLRRQARRQSIIGPITGPVTCEQSSQDRVGG